MIMHVIPMFIGFMVPYYLYSNTVPLRNQYIVFVHTFYRPTHMYLFSYACMYAYEKRCMYIGL